MCTTNEHSQLKKNGESHKITKLFFCQNNYVKAQGLLRVLSCHSATSAWTKSYNSLL